MKNKSIRNFNRYNKEVVQYAQSALKYPLRFFMLLVLAGYSTVKAQKLMFDLKNSMKRSGNIEVRRELLHLLNKLIDIITSDTIIYAKLRNLAIGHNLGSLKEEVRFYIHNTNNTLEISEQMRYELQEMMIPVIEDMQTTGTQLSSASAQMMPGTTNGIDAGIFPKNKKIKRRGNKI